MPLVQVLNTVSNFAMRAEFELTWASSGDGPVALIRIPEHREDLEKLLHLESLEVREGKLFVSGRTEIDTEIEEASGDGPPLLGRAEDVTSSRN